MRENPERILNAERVYTDVFPFVRLGQGLWLAFAVLFGLTGLIPVFFWRLRLNDIDENNTGIIDGLVPLIVIVVVIAVSFAISVSICRMSKWLGYVLLFYSASALCFMALLVLWLVVGSILEVSDGRAAPLAICVGRARVRYSL